EPDLQGDQAGFVRLRGDVSGKLEGGPVRCTGGGPRRHRPPRRWCQSPTRSPRHARNPYLLGLLRDLAQGNGPQWRRQHRDSVDATFAAHLLTEFGDRAVGAITKADVLTFRAKLAEMPGRSSPKLSPTTVNRT